MAQPQARALQNVLDNIKVGINGADTGYKALREEKVIPNYMDGASGPSYSPSPPPPGRSNNSDYDEIVLERIDEETGLPRNKNAARYYGREEDAVSDRLDTATELERLLIRSPIPDNVDPCAEIVRIINDDDENRKALKFALGSTVIEPGKLGIINWNGVIQVVGTGRYTLPNPRANWAKIVSLTENPIRYETLTIVRVNRGEYGLAIEDGKPKMLAEGLHVKNTRLFQHVGFKQMNQKHIQHGTVHILIVPSYEYALVIESNVPKILKAGIYVVDSPYFVVEGFVPVNNEHIQHNTLHIVRVPKGKVALISENNRFGLLPQGTYTFNTQVFAYSGLREINEGSIVHGTITRFRIRNGEIGLAWHNNKPIFIEQPDFYEIDSPNFTYIKSVPASEKNISLGSRKRIIVYDGEVGVSYVNGRLDILKPKTHTFDDAERIFYGFISTRQQSLYLVEDGAKDHYLRCDTKDFVEVGIKACVFYKISDPEKGLLSVGDETAVAKLIKDTSIATLQSIMRSSGLNQVAQSKHVHASQSEEPKANPGDGPSAPLFFDKVHDEFIFHLHDTFSKMYGIEIANIRIESFKIMNTALADNISQQAIITAQTETKLANLEGQREIATAEMERESEVVRIKAQSAAKLMATEAEARNTSLLADAKAKAQAAKIVAQGEADALLIKAEAEAKAIEVKAAAERKRAEELSATPLGEKLALMNVQAQMVTSALQGVQKIIYLPSNANLAQSPLQLFGIPGAGVTSLEDSSFNTETATKNIGKK